MTKVRYLHRVLESEAASWVARGWSIVLIEDNSPSLRAQGQRVALLELVEDTPVFPDDNKGNS